MMFLKPKSASKIKYHRRNANNLHHHRNAMRRNTLSSLPTSASMQSATSSQQLSSTQASSSTLSRGDQESVISYDTVRRPFARTIQLHAINLQQQPIACQQRRNSTVPSKEERTKLKLRQIVGSIGGIFGRLTVFLVCALIYNILADKDDTADEKHRENLYYSLAIGINFSLMIACILISIFINRYYDNKRLARQQQQQPSTTVAATAAPANTTVTNIIMEELPPPQYYGLFGGVDGTPSNKTNETSSTSIDSSASSENTMPRRSNSSSAVLRQHHPQLHRTVINVTHNHHANEITTARSSSASATYLPPNYFEIYPIDAGATSNANNNGSNINSV